MLERLFVLFHRSRNIPCYVSVMIASSKFFYSIVSDCTEPFIVNFYTDAAAGIATQAQRGVCFDYVQTPC